MDQGLETTARGIFERAKAIILTPKDEWLKIAGETTSQRDILLHYAIPLTAIGPVASFIGGQMFGYGAFGFSYRRWPKPYRHPEQGIRILNIHLYMLKILETYDGLCRYSPPVSAELPSATRR